VAFHSGYGSADLSVALSNGLITSVGQKTDTKVPETLNAISGLIPAVAKVAIADVAPKGTECAPQSYLFKMVDGVPSPKPIMSFNPKVVPAK
jgi:hypothetical protein